MPQLPHTFAVKKAKQFFYAKRLHAVIHYLKKIKSLDKQQSTRTKLLKVQPQSLVLVLLLEKEPHEV